MSRNLTEFLKIPESIRIRYLAGAIYRFAVKYDNESIKNEIIPSNPLNQEKREEFITVSMTSFPARIHYVYLAIKSLMLQTYKPDRIVLWLAEEQFPDKKLPEQLTELQQYGLEICWTAENLYGHKKYFESIKRQRKNELVITYDDDLIYPSNSISKLIKTHNKYKNCIVCNRAQALAYNDDGTIKNPGRWDTISDIGIKTPTYQIAPSTGGGCLYPYGAINTELLCSEKIKEIALRGDDLWIMFVAAQSGTKMIKSCKYHKPFSTLEGSQIEQLAQGNILNDEYMQTMINLENAFPKAWQRIIFDKD